MTVTCRITSPETAATLARGRGTQFLSPYFEQPTSVADAAKMLGQRLTKVHYWTRRWHDLGLLQVTATQARAGRPIKLYRTTADVFEVPGELLPATLYGRQIDSATRSLQAAFETSVPDLVLGGVLRVRKDPDRRHVTTDRDWPPAAQTRRPDAFEAHFTTSLTPDQAGRLKQELTDLLHRWTQRTDDTAPGTHLVMLAMAPLPPGPKA